MMSDVIRVYLDGEIADACGPDCYDDSQITSTCICGGHNSGLGPIGAIVENLNRLAEIRKRISKRHPASNHFFILLPIRPDERPTDTVRVRQTRVLEF